MGNQTTVAMATVGGALALVLVLVLNYILTANGHEPLPDQLGQALGVVFTGIFTYVVPHNVKPSGGAGLALLLAGGLGLSACANPAATAQTPMQKAYAVYGTYVIAQGAALEVVQSPEVPADLRRAVQRAEGVAHPAAQGIVEVVREVLKYPEGTVPPPLYERVVDAVLVALPRVEALVTAIQSARQGRGGGL